MTSPEMVLERAVRAAPRSLRVSFVWALAGNVCYAAAQCSAVVLLARRSDPAMVGRFALALAIVSPIAMLTNLQLRTVQATDTGGRYCLGHYVAMRLIGTTMFLLTVAVAARAGGYDAATVILLGAVASMKAAESFSDAVYGLLHAQERLDRIAQSQILKAVLSVAVMTGVSVWTGSATAAIAALALVFWLTLLTFDLALVAGRWRPLWDVTRLGELFRISLPLGVTLLLVSVNANLPRYFLQHYRGVSEVGVFSALAYVTVSANLLVMALGQALAPRMAQAAVNDRKAYLRLSAKMFALAATVGGAGLLVAVLAGRPLLRLLYGADYARENQLFLWLMFSGLVSLLASAAGYSLTSARFFRAQFPVLLLVCAATAAGCAWLVPGRGTAGAAMAQAGGYAVQLGASLAYLVHAFRGRWPVS